MRTINYKVTQQLIQTEERLDDIYKGTQNYLNLKFEFDDNWDDCVKAIVFEIKGKEHPMLLKNDQIEVPQEACSSDFIWFYLVGKKKGYRVQTKKAYIKLR